MSFRQFVTNLFAARQTPETTNPDPWRISYNRRALSGVVITPDTAPTVAAVWACLRYLSQTVAMLPWRVMREGPRGGELAPRHPVDYLVYERPNDEWSSFQFRETLLHWALRGGNGYAEIERDSLGRPIAMWPLHWTRVQPRRDDEGRLIYRVYANEGGGGGFVDLDMMDVFHIRGFGEGPVGVNVMAYAAESIGWAKAAQLFGAAFLGNGMNISAVVETQAALDEPARKRLRAALDNLYRGPRNAGRYALLDAGQKYSPVQIDPDKGQFIATNEYLVAEISRWFGVPPHKIADLSHGTFCLPGDAIIATEFGPKKIRDIGVGLNVWSLGADGNLALKSVIKSGSTGFSRILTIKTRGRTLRCNGQHRVLVRREILEPAQKRRGLYTTIDGKRYHKAWVNVYVSADELKVGDKLVAVDALPVQNGTRTPTREATIEFMELAGHLIGDGFYFKSHRNGKLAGFGISHAINDDCVPHYIAAAEKVFENVERYTHGRPAGNLALKAVQRDENTVTFGSVAASIELDECGLVGTAKTKRIPGWVFTLRPELQLAFLRGYLDADGTVNKLGQIRFVSANRDLLEDVRQLCMGVGIRCGEVFATERNSHFDGYEPTRSFLYGLICSDPKSNATIGSNDPTRRERLATAQTRKRVRSVTVWGSEARRRVVGTGLRDTLITSIEYSEDFEEVYDLCVDDNHSFISNGVIVHNSNIEHQSIEVVVDSILPWARRFEAEADFKLFGRQNRQSFYTRMNLTTLLRGDVAARTNYYQALLQRGVLSINDVLRAEDLNTIGPDGEERLIQSQNVTLKSILDGTANQPTVPPPSQNDPGSGDGIPAVDVGVAEIIALASAFAPAESVDCQSQ